MEARKKCFASFVKAVVKEWMVKRGGCPLHLLRAWGTCSGESVKLVTDTVRLIEMLAAAPCLLHYNIQNTV